MIGMSPTPPRVSAPGVVARLRSSRPLDPRLARASDRCVKSRCVPLVSSPPSEAAASRFRVHRRATSPIVRRPSRTRTHGPLTTVCRGFRVKLAAATAAGPVRGR